MRPYLTTHHALALTQPRRMLWEGHIIHSVLLDLVSGLPDCLLWRPRAVQKLLEREEWGPSGDALSAFFLTEAVASLFLVLWIGVPEHYIWKKNVP